jgi:hypothetical protein
MGVRLVKRRHVMKHKDTPHRTIAITPERRSQIAVASAALGISGARFIECAIISALWTLAERDKVLAHMLARAGGVDWAELEAANHADLLARLAP